MPLSLARRLFSLTRPARSCFGFMITTDRPIAASAQSPHIHSRVSAPQEDRDREDITSEAVSW
jgi:hypothetical protein